MDYEDGSLLWGPDSAVKEQCIKVGEVLAFDEELIERRMTPVDFLRCKNHLSEAGYGEPPRPDTPVCNAEAPDLQRVFRRYGDLHVQHNVFYL